MKPTRRDFCKLMNATFMGATLSPLEVFVRGVIDGLTQQAQAQVMSTDPKALVAIRAAGAPARWAWDHILNPNGEALLPCPNVTTHFSEVSGRLVQPEYSTFQYREVHVPHTWSFPVPRAGGGTRPMTDLLNNMVVLRGIDVVDNGHIGAQKKQYMNPGNIASIQGSLSDATKYYPLPSIFMGASGLSYQSRKNIQKIDLAIGNPATHNFIKSILSPFNMTAKPVRALALANDFEVQSALHSLTTLSTDLSEPLRNNIKNADEIIRAGLGDLDGVWVGLRAKYRGLITAAFEQNFPGINDKPVGAIGSRNLRYRLANGIDPTVSPDDLRSLFKDSTAMGSTAEQFAMVEYMLINGYSNSFVINLDQINNLAFDKNNPAANGTFIFDQHFTGLMMTTFLTPYVFCALSACLLELIDRLKASQRYDGRNLFNETVIQFGGEFNRTGSKEETGTDHSAASSSFAHWSGVFNGPTVVGNIINRHRSNYYFYGSLPGTWGLAARIPEFQNQIAGTGHMLTSLANMLRVPNPSPNTMGMVTENGTSLIGPAKIVPHTEG